MEHSGATRREKGRRKVNSKKIQSKNESAGIHHETLKKKEYMCVKKNSFSKTLTSQSSELDSHMLTINNIKRRKNLIEKQTIHQLKNQTITNKKKERKSPQKKQNMQNLTLQNKGKRKLLEPTKVVEVSKPFSLKKIKSNELEKDEFVNNLLPKTKQEQEEKKEEKKEEKGIKRNVKKNLGNLIDNSNKKEKILSNEIFLPTEKSKERFLSTLTTSLSEKLIPNLECNLLNKKEKDKKNRKEQFIVFQKDNVSTDNKIKDLEHEKQQDNGKVYGNQQDEGKEKREDKRDEIEKHSKSNSLNFSCDLQKKQDDKFIYQSNMIELNDFSSEITQTEEKNKEKEKEKQKEKEYIPSEKKDSSCHKKSNCTNLIVDNNSWGPSFGTSPSISNNTMSSVVVSPLCSWYLSNGPASFIKSVNFTSELKNNENNNIVKERNDSLINKDIEDSKETTRTDLFLKNLAQANWRLWYGKIDPNDILDPPIISQEKYAIPIKTVEEESKTTSINSTITKDPLEELKLKIQQEKKASKDFERQLLLMLHNKQPFISMNKIKTSSSN